MPVWEAARRGGAPEPDVCFRIVIVHVALDAADGTPAYRSQNVQVALDWRESTALERSSQAK
jgi:hypothetical protein